nr:hypothetical protein [uncultured Flavobacterium sp.]
MNKRFYFILYALLFLQTPLHVYSQSLKADEVDKGFINSLKNAGLKEAVIGEIQQLLLKKNETNKTNQKQQEELKSKYPIQFRDDDILEEYSNKKFILSLSKLVTIEQFEKIFLPQLEYRIDRVASEKWELEKGKYKLSKEQEKKFRNLLSENTKKELIIREYYSYDDNLSWNNYKEETLQSSKKEYELLNGFGLLYSKNAKTDKLIKKLLEANIDVDRINQILSALQTLEEKNDRRLKTWRENDARNIINFNDPGEDDYAIYLVFREKLSKILKIEEFKLVFVSQMQDRINRDSQKEYETIKASYTLSEVQYNEIQKLINEKNTEKIVTEEYYKYSYELYQQKLRAVEYRHEKGIREAIQKFNLSKS